MYTQLAMIVAFWYPEYVNTVVGGKGRCMGIPRAVHVATKLKGKCNTILWESSFAFGWESIICFAVTPI